MSIIKEDPVGVLLVVLCVILAVAIKVLFF